jgi:hypothetical protein
MGRESSCRGTTIYLVVQKLLWWDRVMLGIQLSFHLGDIFSETR